MVRGYRDRADDSLLTLLGDLPDLVSNLVKAEIDAAKTWIARTSKDAGIGSVWFLVALFFLFWAVPVLLVFAIAGIASWLPVWLSAIIVLVVLLLAVALFALLGILKFRKVLANYPRGEKAQKLVIEHVTVAEDIRIVKEAGDDVR